MNILIANQSLLLRSGLRGLFNRTLRTGKMYEADSLNLLTQEVRKNKIDLLLLDSAFPNFNPLKLITQLRKEFPSIYIVGSCLPESRLVFTFHEAGVNALICQNITLPEVAELVEHAGQGKTYYCKDFSEALLQNFLQREKHQRHNTQVAHLTKREIEVLKLICEQFDTIQIAERLFISDLTVRRHRQNLLEKTGAINTAGLVIYAIQHGIYRILESS